jgi:hypothetical protein
MSLILNLNEKTLTVPKNFNDYYKQDTIINIDKDNIDTILNILSTLIDKGLKDIIDINISNIFVTKGDFINKKPIDMDKNFNNLSTKPFLNIYSFNDFLYMYYSNDINNSYLKIIGHPNFLYLLYETKIKNICQSDRLDNKLTFSCIDIYSYNNKKCPVTISSIICPNTKPYYYALLVCGIIIFFMTLFFIYNFTKENKFKSN